MWAGLMGSWRVSNRVGPYPGEGVGGFSRRPGGDRVPYYSSMCIDIGESTVSGSQGIMGGNKVGNGKADKKCSRKQVDIQGGVDVNRVNIIF